MDMVNGILIPIRHPESKLETGQWLTNQHGLEPANSTGKVLHQGYPTDPRLAFDDATDAVYTCRAAVCF